MVVKTLYFHQYEGNRSGVPSDQGGGEKGMLGRKGNGVREGGAREEGER